MALGPVCTTWIKLICFSIYLHSITIKLTLCFIYKVSQEVSEQLESTSTTVVTNVGLTKTTKKPIWEHAGRPILSGELPTPRELYSRKCKYPLSYNTAIICNFPTHKSERRARQWNSQLSSKINSACIGLMFHSIFLCYWCLLYIQSQEYTVSYSIIISTELIWCRIHQLAVIE